MQHSEREHERDALLEASQEEWAIKYAELQSTAVAASQRMHDQHQLVEALASRLQATENTASEEVNRLQNDASEMRQEFVTIKSRLARAESAETMTKQTAVNAVAEAEAARQENKSLWSEMAQLRRSL